jgi:hypothetical protein
MSEAENHSAPRCCSYCLLPPKVAGKNLKRCSRCHKAWYHDAECQRLHFPVHKRDCRKWSAAVAAAANSPKHKPSRNISDNSVSRVSSVPPNKKFCVQEREGRGKCLVVSPGNSIRKGELIRDHETRRDFWEPLILPVLHEEQRTSRCALCFGRLPPQPDSICSFDMVAPHKNPLYRLLFCSTICRVAASRNGLKQEELDCRSFLQRIHGQGHKPPRIFSTAIILYRILIREHRQQHSDIDSQYIRDQVRALQSTSRREKSNVNDDTTDVEDHDNYHTRGVIAIAMGMLQCSELSLSFQYRPSMEYLDDMVHRIKVNGFSIFYEKDFETCGLGLYSTPSFMNHSCRANALQTFLFRVANPPSLYLTAFRDIAQNQEICISYTDTSCPSHMRRQRLEKEYYFLCTCEACDNNSDLQDDSMTMAIRCMDCCKNKPSSSPSQSCSLVIRADRGMVPSRPVYKCSECNTTDFESALRQLRAFEKEVSNDRLFSSVNNSSNELHHTYHKLQKLCYTNSWYVQEAGDRLLQEYLHKLPMLVGDPTQEQQTACAALKLGEELLLGNNAQSSSSTVVVPVVQTIEFLSTSSFLRVQHLRHKVAKLRLFLVPDPRQSIQELQEILSSLRPYFSEDHAAIVEVKASLASAMV